MDQVIAGIGAKIRQLRWQKGLSLQKLADQAGLSPAAVHKIERSGMVPTITTLMKLAHALNRPVGYFVEETQDAKPVSFIRADERHPVFTSKDGLTLNGITGSYGQFFIAGAAADVAPGADSGEHPMEHPGEELVHVLSGTLLFDIDGEPYKLQAGDTIHFRTDRPHSWRNPSPEPVEALWFAMRSR